MSNTIYWHDYEAFGANPRQDRASQFAGLRTDEALNVIGDPLVLYCQPAPDMLPHPEACLLTGITPQQARDRGVCEAGFIDAIHRELSVPGTCTAGYNSVRFDDELTRQLLYRNFFDPYEREWKNGNSRWDIIDVLRLCHALRPEGIVWPKRADGATSFRLEELTAANGIDHEGAHDALSDVRATIALAALVRRVQPRLYDYAYGLRRKRAVQDRIDLQAGRPFLHVSSMYPAEFGAMAPVMPLATHPVDANGLIVYDLRHDPADWLHLDAAAIRRRLFTPREEMAENETRIPLKVLHVNRCPAIAPLNALDRERAAVFQMDLDVCRRHWQRLQAHRGLEALMADVFTRPPADSPENDSAAPENPDLMLYGGGFFSDADKAVMREVRSTDPEKLGSRHFEFHDPRLPEMLFRYRARNYPGTLEDSERQRWQAFCRDMLLRPADVPGPGLPLAVFDAALLELKARLPVGTEGAADDASEPGAEGREAAIISALGAWRDEVCLIAGLGYNE